MSYTHEILTIFWTTDADMALWQSSALAWRWHLDCTRRSGAMRSSLQASLASRYCSFCIHEYVINVTPAAQLHLHICEQDRDGIAADVQFGTCSIQRSGGWARQCPLSFQSCMLSPGACAPALSQMPARCDKSKAKGVLTHCPLRRSYVQCSSAVLAASLCTWSPASACCWLSSSCWASTHPGTSAVDLRCCSIALTM